VLNISEFRHFYIFYISKSSLATLRCGRKNDHDFIETFLRNPNVKELLKSANIWQSYERKISLVFWLTVYICKLSKPLNRKCTVKWNKTCKITYCKNTQSHDQLSLFGSHFWELWTVWWKSLLRKIHWSVNGLVIWSIWRPWNKQHA